MKLLRLLIISIFSLTAAKAQQPYWQQRVDYKMDVSLNPNDNTLQAFARINYTNNSPDTLRFIWFHLWPNAYRNDKTAFSDQLLENGRTDFYFSSNEERGYINRLDWRIDDKPVKAEDHPEHIDIVKLILPGPLAPGASVMITTPFQVKLPFNFSRSGYNGKTYQVTQWYPKAAVYDARGWHPMPYLDQGEFYADFGDYEVSITVPEKFVVAATGEPQFKVEDAVYIPKRQPKAKAKPGAKKVKVVPFNWDVVERKTYTYKQTDVVDFAWFADTTFTVQQGVMTLPSGRQIRLRCYFHLDKIDVWANAINFMKDAIRYHSEWIGEYPYDDVTVVDGAQGFSGGMEYPTITVLNGTASARELDLLIFHEVGHNWFQATLASNERKYPWMDEGMTTYYDNRYEQMKYPFDPKMKGLGRLVLDPRLPELLLRTQVRFGKDQPMNTPSDSLTADNYNLIAYEKSAIWMKKLEQNMGQPAFDSAMKQYYAAWKFKHPQPEDFERALQEGTLQEPALAKPDIFQQINEQGNVNPEPFRPLKVVPLYKLRETYTSRPIFVTPIASYNSFNGLMPGIAFHNYSLPLPRFNYLVIPLYGLKSNKMNGMSRLAYHWYPKGSFSHIELASVFSMFNLRIFDEVPGNKYSLAYRKIAPVVKFTFREPFVRSTVERFIQARAFFIGEDDIRFIQDPVTNEEVAERTTTRYNIYQARYVYRNFRKLYPFRASFMVEGNQDFMRLNASGNYFFNFRKKGGVNVRLYAGKFIYLVSNDLNNQFALQRYHLNMTGPNGEEDYTYSAPFIGRFETSGLWSQQIMQRDGFFKVRADLLAEKIGRSDDWLTALNFTMDVPDRFNILAALPIKIPLKLFADVGASGATWSGSEEGSRLLYDGGFQISLLNNIVNFYFPLVYSGVYRDYYKSVPGNSFFQRMSFSINIQDLTFRDFRQQFSRK